MGFNSGFKGLSGQGGYAVQQGATPVPSVLLDTSNVSVLCARSTPGNLAASTARFWRDKLTVNFTTM